MQSIAFFSFFDIMYTPLSPDTKTNLQNDSNFQTVAHIKIIPRNTATSGAPEMRKIYLKPVPAFSTHTTLPTRWNVHLLYVTQSLEC